MRDRGYYRSDWIIRGGVVYSFARPEPHALGAFLDGGYETISTSEWANSTDEDVLGSFSNLLRQSLWEQEHRRLWYHRGKRLFLFRAQPESRVTKVKVVSRKPGRTVVQPYFKEDDQKEVKHYRHYAADVRFVRIDDGWVAEINPTYHFTFDGKRDLPWGAERLKGIKKLERNPAVRGLVRFWAEFLARPPELGETPRQILFGDLVTVDVEIGIDDKAWKPAEANGGAATGEFCQPEML